MKEENGINDFAFALGKLMGIYEVFRNHPEFQKFFHDRGVNVITMRENLKEIAEAFYRG